MKFVLKSPLCVLALIILILFVASCSVDEPTAYEYIIVSGNATGASGNLSSISDDTPTDLTGDIFGDGSFIYVKTPDEVMTWLSDNATNDFGFNNQKIVNIAEIHGDSSGNLNLFATNYFIIKSTRGSNQVAMYFQTTNTTAGTVNRLTITGGVDVAEALWKDVLHRDFAIADGRTIDTASFDSSSYDIRAWRNDVDALQSVMSIESSTPPYVSFSNGAIEIYNNNYLRFQVPFELIEVSAPSTPSSNRARIYAMEGAGDGLTDVCAKFQDGSVDIFAQETTELDNPIFRYDSGTIGQIRLRKPHAGLAIFEMVFPDGSSFVLKEIEFHDSEHIAVNKGVESFLPSDWEVTTAEERALFPDVPTDIQPTASKTFNNNVSDNQTK